MPSPLVHTTLGGNRRACVKTPDGLRPAPLHTVRLPLWEMGFEIDHSKESPTKGELRFTDSVVLPPSYLVYVLEHNSDRNIIWLEYHYHDGNHLVAVAPGRLIVELSHPVNVVENFHLTTDAPAVYRWLSAPPQS